MDGGMPGMMTPPSPPPSANGTSPHVHAKIMMHMSFFWGTNSEILFKDWPGYSKGMYALALITVFFLSVLVEWLNHSKMVRPTSGHVVAGFLRTLIHVIRVGLAYMVMLAVMSFNAGVFLVAVAGHGVGFFVFGSRVFGKEDGTGAEKTDLPPMSC